MARLQFDYTTGIRMKKTTCIYRYVTYLTQHYNRAVSVQACNNSTTPIMANPAIIWGNVHTKR